MPSTVVNWRLLWSFTIPIDLHWGKAIESQGPLRLKLREVQHPPNNIGNIQQGFELQNRLSKQGLGSLQLQPQPHEQRKPQKLVCLHVCNVVEVTWVFTHKYDNWEERRSGRTYKRDQTTPEKGLSHVWLNRSYLIFYRGERKEHSFRGATTPSRVIEIKIARWRILEGVLRREKWREVFRTDTHQHTTQPETSYKSWEDSYLHIAYDLLFYFYPWPLRKKIDQWKS